MKSPHPITNTLSVLTASLLAAITSTFSVVADVHPYLDAGQQIETRVEDLLSRLTLEEKISIVHADTPMSTPAIPRLGIPTRCFADGAHGVRQELGPTWQPADRTDDYATAMPVTLCLAATWNPELAGIEAEAIGQEARARGKDIMNAPGVNIMRAPLCGRNFEYMGEDPFLTSRMTVDYIHGEQSQDVAMCVKHFAVNSQEYQRHSYSAEVDERTLHEIYFPAFKAAVQEAGVWCVMGAYNKLRGQYCCENDYLLNKVLKGEWGFKGLVVSDWGGTHDTREAALNGLDIEMGSGIDYDHFYFAQPYLDALKNGELPMSGLDEKVRRSLRVMFATHVFDPGRTNGSLNTIAHQMVARQVAEEGIVLLKNKSHLLPLDAAKIKSIAVIGENAVRLHCNSGGSSEVKALYEITPLEGILHRAGNNVNITFSQGYEANEVAQSIQDGEVKLTFPPQPANLMERAVAAARAADVVIYVGGLHHGPGFDDEGPDRTDLKLPYGQNELISRIVAANPKTIVVLEGSVVEMESWLGRVPAVLEAWYPGMEGGNALARVLFGDVNPSGKLPCTFPKKLADTPTATFGVEAYPGTNGMVTYKEGMLVGYRWYDTKDIEPQFPFGYGLSYTTFKYSPLKLIPGTDTNGPVVTVEFDITNTGRVSGAEVAQLYVHQEKPGVPRPEKELKAFKKIFLKPGETRTVSITLARTAFAYYSSKQKAWVSEAGSYMISAGSSSRDMRQQSDFTLAKTSSKK